MTGPSYESLIGYDPELLRRDPPEYKLIPHLAESYSTDDRIVWTFNLRRGIKFHTGNEMQADDVKFSIERVARWEEYIDPEATGSPPNIRSVVPVIERVEIVDDYTVRIHGRDGKPQLLMLDTLSFGHLAIMDREAVEANAKDGDSGLAWLRSGNSAGTGPYRVVEALPREKTVYEKFEDYWGGVANNPDPFFDRVVLINIPEAGRAPAGAGDGRSGRGVGPAERGRRRHAGRGAGWRQLPGAALVRTHHPGAAHRRRSPHQRQGAAGDQVRHRLRGAGGAQPRHRQRPADRRLDRRPGLQSRAGLPLQAGYREGEGADGGSRLCRRPWRWISGATRKASRASARR